MTMFEHVRTATEAVEAKTIHNPNFRLRANLAAIALMGVTIPANVYWQDVTRNQEVQASASMNIEVRHEPLDPKNNRSAIIAMDGFGTYDADNLAKHIGPVAQRLNDGEVWSVAYGNAPLDPEDITERIVQTARERGVTNVSILGYSAGGVVGTQVVEQLVTSTNIDVEMLMAVSAPDGVSALRTTQVKEIEVANIIENIPGASYSTAVRYLGEMYFRRDKIAGENPVEWASNALATHNDVVDALDDKKLPGTWLLIDQVAAIANAKIEERIENISEAPADKKRPVIVYLGTAEPGYDYMVNDDLSGKNFFWYAVENNLEAFRADVPGAVHTRPELANDNYLATAEKLEPFVQDAIAKELARVQDARYDAKHIPPHA